MNRDNLTIMLGLSFYKNSDQVLETLQSFSTAVSETPYRLILGLENELHKNAIPPTKRGGSLFEVLSAQGWDRCYLWDEQLNRAVMAVLPNTTAQPFFGNFSYGAAVNRLMLLADMAGASVLVRIDPGTECGPDFPKLLDYHRMVVELNPGSVVSAQYSRRQAIRDEFIAPDNHRRYYELIYEYTGINPAPGCQLTGGAAFTMTADSPPAIPFDGVKVWGSDDGFFQVVDPGRAVVQKEFVIERSEAGFGMDLTSYMERVANMVVLKALHDGHTADDGFEVAARFVDEVEGVVDAGHRFDKVACLGNVKKAAVSIAQGYVNYFELKRCWRDLQRTIREQIPIEAADAYRRNTHPHGRGSE